MAKTPTLEEGLSALWDAASILALPASEQLAILEAAGDSRAIDELVLNYDDSYWVIKEAETQGVLMSGELEALRALDCQLDRMSGEANAGNWTVKALRFANCWKEVRTLATTALATRQIAKARRSAQGPEGGPLKTAQSR